MSTARIITGDVREVLPTLEAGSVQCVVTSPPYFGLRSYLPKDHPDKAKEIGTERTHVEYVEKIVGIFREVRRVLRDDGTVFLNLGDSYFAGRGGGSLGRARSASREFSCDTSGTARSGSRLNDCPSENLCDECRATLAIRTARSNHSPVLEPASSPSVPSRAHTGSSPGRLPTSDSEGQTGGG